MNGKSDLTDAASQDWSKFDFTRWNLEGLHFDPQPAAVSAWLRDLLLSPQGPQEFAAAVDTVKTAALQDLQDQAKVIQGRILAIDSELTARTDATQKGIAAIENKTRVASAPMIPTPDPESFQVATKVVDEASRLGLPGLQVRLYDTQSPKVTLATVTTDQNGDALLKLNREQTDTLAKTGSTLGVEVLTPGNKSVFAGGSAPAPKLNQTGTVVASLSASTDLAPHLNAANASMAQQQALLNAMMAKVEDLQTYYQQIKAELQQDLEEVQGIAAGLQSSSNS